MNIENLKTKDKEEGKTNNIDVKRLNEFAYQLGILTSMITSDDICNYLHSKGVLNSTIITFVNSSKQIAQKAFYDIRS